MPHWRKLGRVFDPMAVRDRPWLKEFAQAPLLRVVHRSGIFFKALANVQWDALVKTDIVSQDYLDGCYALGQVYPDLCASIYLVCEAGRAA